MSDNEHGVLLEKSFLAPKVTRYLVRAPDVARRRRPGQFVIVRMREGGERIPLTIADGDKERGPSRSSCRRWARPPPRWRT